MRPFTRENVVGMCWDEIRERKLLRPEHVQITTNKVKVIRKRINEALDR